VELQDRIHMKRYLPSVEMTSGVSLLWIVVGWMILTPSAAFANQEIALRAFGPGERLVYDIRYLGMSAGTGVMEVKAAETLGGRRVYPIVSTAQSNDMVSLFYPVNDRIESRMDAAALYSHRIDIRQHQGKKRREKVIVFDQVRHIAVQQKNDQEMSFPVPPAVQDSLTSLYFFRNQTFPPVGQSIFIPVHESEKNWNLEIRIVGREQVATPVGRFDTVKVQALLRYKGIFLDEGDVFIWMTDDIRHLPVQIYSSIKIGTVVATLISRHDGALPAPPRASRPSSNP